MEEEAKEAETGCPKKTPEVAWVFSVVPRATGEKHLVLMVGYMAVASVLTTRTS